jgi:predicted ester cyclase
VVTRWTLRGTHRGTYQGVAPTGKQITMAGVSIYRFAEGKVAEGWVSYDALGLLQQIGAVPA